MQHKPQHFFTSRWTRPCTVIHNYITTYIPANYPICCKQMYVVCMFVINRIDAIPFFFLDLEKKDHEILAAMQYKPLYNICRREKWGKKIHGAAYNGARTVFNIALYRRVLRTPQYFYNVSSRPCTLG